jgi:hypothetical protein
MPRCWPDVLSSLIQLIVCQPHRGEFAPVSVRTRFALED